ncbi:hypothetical protein SCHPADRAFT_927132 [Schizopora paradoxa]|uniref:Uncharacterized protein n=1 Tax=Schizopora paradoxa TaxID=27342 RepID=A0A0H2SER3_9AGAM|nr:hypothetical protein SCHPADRAFT_927132 [Schizopora paradoxa]
MSIETRIIRHQRDQVQEHVTTVSCSLLSCETSALGLAFLLSTLARHMPPVDFKGILFNTRPEFGMHISFAGSFSSAAAGPYCVASTHGIPAVCSADLLAPTFGIYAADDTPRFLSRSPNELNAVDDAFKYTPLHFQMSLFASNVYGFMFAITLVLIASVIASKLILAITTDTSRTVAFLIKTTLAPTFHLARAALKSSWSTFCLAIASFLVFAGLIARSAISGTLPHSPYTGNLAFSPGIPFKNAASVRDVNRNDIFALYLNRAFRHSQSLVRMFSPLLKWMNDSEYRNGLIYALIITIFFLTISWRMRPVRRTPIPAPAKISATNTCIDALGHIKETDRDLREDNRALVEDITIVEDMALAAKSTGKSDFASSIPPNKCTVSSSFTEANPLPVSLNEVPPASSSDGIPSSVKVAAAEPHEPTTLDTSRDSSNSSSETESVDEDSDEPKILGKRRPTPDVQVNGGINISAGKHSEETEDDDDRVEQALKRLYARLRVVKSEVDETYINMIQRRRTSTFVPTPVRLIEAPRASVQVTRHTSTVDEKGKEAASDADETVAEVSTVVSLEPGVVATATKRGEDSHITVVNEKRNDSTNIRQGQTTMDTEKPALDSRPEVEKIAFNPAENRILDDSVAIEASPKGIGIATQVTDVQRVDVAPDKKVPQKSIEVDKSIDTSLLEGECRLEEPISFVAAESVAKPALTKPQTKPSLPIVEVEVSHAPCDSLSIDGGKGVVGPTEQGQIPTLAEAQEIEPVIPVKPVVNTRPSSPVPSGVLPPECGLSPEPEISFSGVHSDLSTGRAPTSALKAERPLTTSVYDFHLSAKSRKKRKKFEEEEVFRHIPNIRFLLLLEKFRSWSMDPSLPAESQANEEIPLLEPLVRSLEIKDDEWGPDAVVIDKGKRKQEMTTAADESEDREDWEELIAELIHFGPTVFAHQPMLRRRHYRFTRREMDEAFDLTAGIFAREALVSDSVLKPGPFDVPGCTRPRTLPLPMPEEPLREEVHEPAPEPEPLPEPEPKPEPIEIPGPGRHYTHNKKQTKGKAQLRRRLHVRGSSSKKGD